MQVYTALDNKYTIFRLGQTATDVYVFVRQHNYSASDKRQPTYVFVRQVYTALDKRQPTHIFVR